MTTIQVNENNLALQKRIENILSIQEEDRARDRAREKAAERRAQKKGKGKPRATEISAIDRTKEKEKRKSSNLEARDEEGFDGELIEVGPGQDPETRRPKPIKKQRRNEGHTTPRRNRQHAMVAVTPGQRQPREDIRNPPQDQQQHRQSQSHTSDDSTDESSDNSMREALAARQERLRIWPSDRRIFPDHRLASFMLRFDARGLHEAAPWAFDRSGNPFEEYEYLKCIAQHVMRVSEETQHRLSLIFG